MIVLVLIASTAVKVLSTDHIEQEKGSTGQSRRLFWWKPKCSKFGQTCHMFKACCSGFTCEQNVCAKEGDVMPTPAPTPKPEPVCKPEGEWCTKWWDNKSCCEGLECAKDGWFHKCSAVTTEPPSGSPAPTAEVQTSPTAAPSKEPTFDLNPICGSEGYLCLPNFNLFSCCDGLECTKEGWFHKCLAATTPAPSMSPAPTGELVTSPTLEPTLSLFNSTTAPSISCGVMPDECGEENKCCAGYKCIPIFRKKFCIKVLSQPIIPPINPICLAEKEKCLPLNKITFRERKSYLNCCQGLVCQKTSTQKFPLNYECVKGSARKRTRKPLDKPTCATNKKRCGTKIQGGLDCCDGFSCCKGSKCDGVARGRCQAAKKIEDSEPICFAETEQCGKKLGKCCDGLECCKGSKCNKKVWKGVCTLKA